jgi:hypothetical protein
VNKGLIAGTVAIGLVATGAMAVPVVERYAAIRIKAEIERDGSSTVGGVEVGLLKRRIALTDLKSSREANVSVGRWQASGLGWPLAELMQGRTPLAGLKWGDPLQADRLELRDLRIGNREAGGTWKVESLVLEGLDLARFDASDVGPYGPLVLVARALGALQVRRLEQRGTVIAMPGSGDTFSLATIVAERYEGGHMATIVVGDIEATAREDRAPLFKVTDVAIGGLDVGRNLAAFSSAEWRPGNPIGQIKVERASATGFSGDTMARYGVSLGAITLETVRESDTVSRSRARIDGFVLAPPLRNMESLKLRLALQAMGLRELKLGFDCTGVEDRARGEITVDRCALSGPNLAEINLTSRIVGADEAFWNAIDDGDVAALYDSKAVLDSARLVLADASLLERGLKALSATTGQPVSTTRANLARDIRRFQPAGVLITQRLTQLLDTVARFVEQGGTLTLDARPEPPLAIDRIDYLMSPGADLVDALGLSATLSR